MGCLTSTRPAGVVGQSGYVHPGAQGVGGALLDALIISAGAAGIWTIGVRERVGQHYGTWRYVILLERRSKAAGA